MIGIGIVTTELARPAYGSDFTSFAEDEDVCRKAGVRAIAGEPEASAAQRYDFAYRRCMVAQAGLRRSRDFPQGSPPSGGNFAGDAHSFDYPEAFYHIPYATPGYGYDGFGY